MDPDKSSKVARRPLRWMLAFLVVIGLAALTLVTVFQLQPESLTNPPPEPKPLAQPAPK